MHTFDKMKHVQNNNAYMCVFTVRFRTVVYSKQKKDKNQNVSVCIFFIFLLLFLVNMLKIFLALSFSRISFAILPFFFSSFLFFCNIVSLLISWFILILFVCLYMCVCVCVMLPLLVPFALYILLNPGGSVERVALVFWFIYNI